MPRLQHTSFAVLAGAVVVLSAACAPRATGSTASVGAPGRCDGPAVLEVQNDLGQDIQILEVRRSASLPPVPVTLVGRGWHTVEIDQADRRRFRAQTVGQSPFTSYSLGPNDSRVRLTVRCLATRLTKLEPAPARR